jgi:hypothetical protein
MKNQIFAFGASAFLLLSVMAGSTGCKKSNGTASNSTTATIQTSATASGTAFSSNSAGGFYYTATKSFDLASAQIKSGDSLIMELTFPDTLALNKSYPLGGSQEGPNLEYTDWKTQDWFATSWSEASGTMTITSLDKNSHNVQGNFNAILWKAGGDSIIVSNGKFNINYLVQ